MRVLTTSSIDILINCVVSYGILYSIPGGNFLDSSPIFLYTASAVSRAFAFVSAKIPMTAAGFPLTLAKYS